MGKPKRRLPPKPTGIAAAVTGVGYKPPKGMVYEWKVHSVLGVAISAGELADIRAAGWKKVPATRHKGPVVNGGLVLMERSRKRHDEAVAERLKAAAAQRDQPIDEILAAHLPPQFHVVIPPAVEFPGTYVATDWGWVPVALWRRLEALGMGERDAA